MLVVVPSRALTGLFTVLRDTNTKSCEFRRHADRIHRIVVEEGLAHLPQLSVTVQTPCGEYAGTRGPGDQELCVVSIIRAGDSLMQAVIDVIPGIAVGKGLPAIRYSPPHPPKFSFSATKRLLSLCSFTQSFLKTFTSATSS